MFKQILILICIFFCSIINARTIKLALIDSGLPKFKTNAKICPDGVYDMTGTDVYDKIGHSTNLMGIIGDELEGQDYCLYIIKIYDENSAKSKFIWYLKALALVLKLENVDIINYSSSGDEADILELELIQTLGQRNVLFVTASGNDHRDLDKKCDIFPICYTPVSNNIIGVGNGKSNQDHIKTSNYGKVVKAWHDGELIRRNGVTMSGSSQSTAFETAEQAKKLLTK